MPRIPRSEQSVGVSGNPMPASTGDGFAAPGKALEKAGTQLSAFALQFQQQQEELGTFEMQRGYQDFVNERERVTREADSNLGSDGGDGRGHADRIDAENDAAYEEFRGQYGHLSPRAQQRLELQYGRDRNRWSTRSFAHQQQRIPQFYNEQANTHWTNNIQPHLFRLDDDGNLVEPRLDSVARGSAMVQQWLDGAAGLPPAAREAIAVEMRNRIFQQWQAAARGEGVAERQQVLRELEARRGGSDGDPRERMADDIPQRDPNAPVTRRPRDENSQAVVDVAGRLGIRPEVLYGLMHFETGGTMRADQRGGSDRDGGRAGQYRGLIQFSPENQQRYGVRPGMSFREQLEGPVARYLQDRFQEAGIDIRTATTAQIYASVLAGNPRAVTRTDANGTRADRTVADIERRGARWLRDSGGGENVVLAQSSIEDRVRQMIIDNPTAIEQSSRSYRVQQDVDERRAQIRNRELTTATLRTRVRITADRLRRGESTPEMIAAIDPESGLPGINMAELDTYREVVRDAAMESMRRRINPLRTTTAVSDPATFTELLGRARRAGTEGGDRPQAIIDLSEEMHTANRLTTRDHELIDSYARRAVRPDNLTPRWVGSYMSALRDGFITQRNRHPTDEESTVYTTALRRFNEYLDQQIAAGSLDEARTRQFVDSLITANRDTSLQNTFRTLREEPRPQYLTQTLDHVTIDDVQAAIVATRAAYDAARTPDEQKRLLADSARLIRIKDAVQRRDRIEGGGRTPRGPGQPSTPGSPRTETSPDGERRTLGTQFPPTNRDAQFPEGPMVPQPAPRSETPPAPPASPLGQRMRTMRRIIRNPDTNEIEGMTEEPLP